LQFVVRTFKGGRSLENALETTIEKMNAPKEPQGPSPQELEMQKDLQAQQIEAQKFQEAERTKQTQAMAEAQKEQVKAMERIEMEKVRRDFDLQMTEQKLAFEERIKQYEADKEAATKIEIAQMQTEAQSKPVNQFTVDSGGKLDNIADTITQAAVQQGAGIAEAVNNLGQVAAVLVGAVDEMKRPKRRVLERDPVTGRAIGAVEITD
jgi:hypothetical protein